jgi:hypothetical protein
VTSWCLSSAPMVSLRKRLVLVFVIYLSLLSFCLTCLCIAERMSLLTLRA